MSSAGAQANGVPRSVSCGIGPPGVSESRTRLPLLPIEAPETAHADATSGPTDSTSPATSGRSDSGRSNCPDVPTTEVIAARLLVKTTSGRANAA